MKMLIEIWMDGYETNEEMAEACREFVRDQLDFAASSIKILWDDNAKDD